VAHGRGAIQIEFPSERKVVTSALVQFGQLVQHEQDVFGTLSDCARSRLHHALQALFLSEPGRLRIVVRDDHRAVGNVTAAAVSVCSMAATT